jgi:hypothetical protein
MELWGSISFMEILMDACAIIAVIVNDEKREKSSLEDIPYIIADITTQEIVDLFRESRAGI